MWFRRAVSCRSHTIYSIERKFLQYRAMPPHFKFIRPPMYGIQVLVSSICFSLSFSSNKRILLWFPIGCYIILQSKENESISNITIILFLFIIISIQFILNQLISSRILTRTMIIENIISIRKSVQNQRR